MSSFSRARDGTGHKPSRSRRRPWPAKSPNRSPEFPQRRGNTATICMGSHGIRPDDKV